MRKVELSLKENYKYKIGVIGSKNTVSAYSGENVITITETTELQDSDRGAGGYGSSDVKEDISAVNDTDKSVQEPAVEDNTSEAVA